MKYFSGTDRDSIEAQVFIGKVTDILKNRGALNEGAREAIKDLTEKFKLEISDE